MGFKKEDYPNYDEALQFTWYLCDGAGKDIEFLKQFFVGLLTYKDIYEEFVYYMEHGEPLAKVAIGGYTLVDVLIFQIDHFRAIMDREPAKIRGNREEMILMAFNTLLKMKVDPEKYLEKMRTETGTDQPR